MSRDLHSIDDIIKTHENEGVEYKRSFRWNHYTGKVDKFMHRKITRAISSFLNTEGGILVIGVDDDRKIIGVEKDILSYNKNNIQKGKDLFLTDIGEKIRKNISASANLLCRPVFKSINNKEIVIINIKKSAQPFFHSKKDFYIRNQNATIKLSKEETYDFFKYKFNIELSKKSLEYLFFTLLGYLRLLKNLMEERIQFYFALIMLSIIYYFIWYINLFIDYYSSIIYFPFQFLLISYFLLGLSIDLLRNYRNSKINEKTKQKRFTNYIPEINKWMVIIGFICFGVFFALYFIGYYILILPIINFIKSIIYLSQFVLISIYYIVLSKYAKKKV